MTARNYRTSIFGAALVIGASVFSTADEADAQLPVIKPRTPVKQQQDLAPQVGETVVVIAAEGTELKTADEVAVEIPGGVRLRINKLQGDRLWVKYRGQEGWIGKSQVLPPDQALSFFDQQIAQSPTAADYRIRGELWWKKGDRARAAADFTEAIRRDPEDAAAYLLRAATYGEKGEVEKALSDLDEAIRINPEFSDGYASRALVFQQQGEVERALSEANQALRLDSTNDLAYALRGIIRTKQGQLDEAFADFSQAIELARSEDSLAFAYFSRGMAWEKKGELQKSLSDYSESIRLDPRFAGVYLKRGDVWEQLGETDKALADYNSAIELDPKDAWAYTQRGLVWAEKQKFNQAISDHTKAISLDPEFAYAYVNRGIAWRQLEEYEKSIADYDRAIQLDPQNADAYYCRALVYEFQRQYDKAIADYTSTIEVDPAYAAAFHNRGVKWKIKGDYEHAIADYKEAIRLDPQYALAHANLAWVLATCPDPKYRNGKQAVQHAKTACELSGCQSPFWLDVLAVAYAEAGDFDEAVKWLTKAMDLAEASEKPRYKSWINLFKSGKPYREDKDLSAGPPQIIADEPEREARASSLENLTIINTQEPLLNLKFNGKPKASQPKQTLFKEVTLDQALKVSPQDLAQAYLATFYTFRMASLAQFGATIITDLDGPTVEVNRENADESIAALKSRLKVYRKAIEQRGYQKVPQQFMATADEGCEAVGVVSGPTLIEQNGFLLTLSQNGTIHEGIIVEDAVNFEHAGGPEIHLVGQINDGKISLTTKVSGLTATMKPAPCTLRLWPSTVVDRRFAEVYLGRGLTKYGAGKFASALKDVEESIKLDPGLALAYTVQSQMLASAPDPEVRNGEKAVQSASRACELVGWDQWQCLAPLAAAHAEAGDFDSAVKWASKAIEISPDLQRNDLEEQLQLYKSGKPFRHNIPFDRPELE